MEEPRQCDLHEYKGRLHKPRKLEQQAETPVQVGGLAGRYTPAFPAAYPRFITD